jgi:cell division protein FtsA
MIGERLGQRIITSIDVGTTKICVLIARLLDSDTIEILGVGKAPSYGLAKGVVVDVAKTIYAIGQAIKEAELMAGLPIEEAIIGISGGHIGSFDSQGLVPIKKAEVRLSDIENVLAAARATPIPDGQQILHVLPKYFTIDGNNIVYDPLGMHGVRLEVKAHIITGAVSSVQNLINCCQQAGVQVSDIVLEQLASAEAVLSDDEKQFGVGVLDIGGGTSDLAIYHQGTIRHTMVLPVAGNHFTNDLAIGLRIKRSEAERIKKEFGICYRSFLDDQLLVEVELVQGINKDIITHQQILDILAPRAIELLSKINYELTTHQLLHYMATGMVLTGGGSLLQGMVPLARQIFHTAVRIGNPHVRFDLPESLNNPIYATGYGLLMHTIRVNKKKFGQGQSLHSTVNLLERMKSWIIDLF